MKKNKSDFYFFLGFGCILILWTLLIDWMINPL